jgi:hypothetical protein
VTPLCETTLDVGDPKPVNPGDIILCNFASYLNLIWLQCYFTPVFVIPLSEDRVIVHSFYSLLLGILSGSPLNSGVPRTFDNVCPVGVPVVVLPEGIPSNGKEILPFLPFAVPNSPRDLHIFGFIHRVHGISPNFTRGSGFLHLFHMTGRTLAGMKVKIAAPRDIPKVGSNDWIKRSRIVLAEMLRLPLSSCNVHQGGFKDHLD